MDDPSSGAQMVSDLSFQSIKNGILVMYIRLVRNLSSIARTLVHSSCFGFLPLTSFTLIFLNFFLLCRHLLLPEYHNQEKRARGTIWSKGKDERRKLQLCPIKNKIRKEWEVRGRNKNVIRVSGPHLWFVVCFHT